MLYSAEQVEHIKEMKKALHASEPKGISLCQYNGVSCVRCCLPHIGGDSIREEVLEGEKQSVNYDRYLGPGEILMKFNNFHPMSPPEFEISHYEDSFEDAGKEENEMRFARRRELFFEVFDPQKPEVTLASYVNQIQAEEGYCHDPESDSAEALFHVYFPGSIDTKGKGGELPECHLLGFIDDQTVGCLGHPAAEHMQGFDARQDFGFFKTDSCVKCSCDWSEEFQYLSDSALKVFDKAIEGMSWYDYSRHGTAVLVAYLRSYDHIMQKLDEKDLLEDISLQQIAELTNNLYENFSEKASCSVDKDLSEWKVPKFPLVARNLKNDTLWWFTGTAKDAEKLDTLNDKWNSLGFGNPERRAAYDVYDHFRDTIEEEVQYHVHSTETGYRFEIDVKGDTKILHVDINNDNSPTVREKDSPDFWRIGVPIRQRYTYTEDVNVLGMRELVRNLDYGVFNCMNSLKILTLDSVTLSEGMFLNAINYNLDRRYYKKQLDILRKKVDANIQWMIRKQNSSRD